MADKVLVADDDAQMRDMLKQHLERAGMQVLPAADGADAKGKLQACSPDDPPALVISDVRMPGISGLHLLQWIRGKLPSTKVILITAFGDTLTHRRAADLGAAAVLDKPFSMGELMQAVAEAVG